MFKKRFVAVLCSGLMMSTATAAFAGAGPAGHDHTHTPNPSVTVAATTVAGNVSVVMGQGGFAGGNVGVSAGPDGLLIVDNLMPGFAYKLEGVLDQLKTCINCGDLKYLINTHWHFDHAGNNEHFGGDAVLIAHQAVRPLLAKEQEVKALNMKFAAKSREGLPDITITRKASVFFNGEEIEITHFPKSHTSGDVAVYFSGSNVLHLGDLYFNGMFPFVDVENGGNVKGIIRSIEAVLAQYPDDVKIIPGHGALSSKSKVRAYLDMLKQTTRTVEKAKSKGMSLEEIQKRGLDEKWQSWAWQFVNTESWIAMVYNSL
ncbi:MBL fold metallo-hydrolase [Pseudomonadota bacterium]